MSCTIIQSIPYTGEWICKGYELFGSISIAFEILFIAALALAIWKIIT